MSDNMDWQSEPGGSDDAKPVSGFHMHFDALHGMYLLGFVLTENTSYNNKPVKAPADMTSSLWASTDKNGENSQSKSAPGDQKGAEHVLYGKEGDEQMPESDGLASSACSSSSSENGHLPEELSTGQVVSGLFGFSMRASRESHFTRKPSVSTTSYEIPDSGSYVATAVESARVVFKPGGKEPPPRDDRSQPYGMPIATSERIKRFSGDKGVPATETITRESHTALLLTGSVLISSCGASTLHQHALLEELLKLDDGQEAPRHTKYRDLFLLEFKSQSSIVLQPNDKYVSTALIYGSKKQKGEAISLLRQYQQIIDLR
ncbi:hypothetical protein PVAG01_02793 [Phlyctema vagabunda]|uniref:Uncharacterized protein n=1 Tax=Phlyctema vagabunda TaxID=108571 RepID=A0ABR4PRP5_9HELO